MLPSTPLSFRVDDRVEAWHTASNRFVVASISSVFPDGSFEVSWDDGSPQDLVKQPDEIREYGGPLEGKLRTVIGEVRRSADVRRADCIGDRHHPPSNTTSSRCENFGRHKMDSECV